MFEKHFGLRENPFPAGHQMRFLYPSREHQEARAHLRYGIENREPFVLITGEVGTGKTTALYDALAEWGAQVSVALITNSALTRAELLEEICLRFGVALPAEVSKPKLLALLERHLLAVRARGEHAVLLLDEAQNLATDLLEEIRLLSNVESEGEKLIQIFLVAQPELEARLGRPELRQLRQRITVHYRLNPLSPEETAGYIHHRISVAGGNAWSIFPPDTCREVYRVTHGIPREINTIASQAMITAFSENAPSVTIEHVRAAQHEAEFNSVLAPNHAKLPSAADMAAAISAKSAAADAPATPAAAPAAAVPPAPRPAEPPAAPPATPATVAIPVPEGAKVVIRAEEREEPEPELEPVVSPALAPPAAAPPEPPVVFAPEPVATSVEAEPPVRPEPPIVASAHPSPHADAPPAWTPEPHEKPTERVESVSREELDAWSVAASDLLKARQRARAGAVEPPAPARDYVPPPANEPPPPLPFPVPPHAAAPANDTDASALPARLREKLEAGLAEEDRHGRALPWMIGVAAIALAVMGIALAQRFGAIDVPMLRGLGGSPAAVDSPQAADALAPAVTPPVGGDSAAAYGAGSHSATQSSAPASGAAASGSSASRPPDATPTTPQPSAAAASAASAGTPAVTAKPATVAASAASPASATPKPVSTAIYGIAAGNYLDENRAGEESARLADLTGLPGRVVRYDDGGTAMYRVVIGNFADEASAERAADRLLARPGVREARVIVLARGKSR